MATALEIALQFVAAINTADLNRMRALMSDDHTFVDALGHRMSGAETMLSGWQHFFHAYPHYQISIDHSLEDANNAALFGTASGGWRSNETVLHQTWSVSAAWLAEAKDGRIATWSVFCDTGWASPPKP